MTVTITLCILSFFFTYCIVWDYNYAMVMPVLPVVLWLWRQERSPWLRRLLLGLLFVLLAVFLPTPVLLDPPNPNRFWVASTAERVLPLLAAFLGLFAYGMAFFCARGADRDRPSGGRRAVCGPRSGAAARWLPCSAPCWQRPT